MKRITALLLVLAMLLALSCLSSCSTKAEEPAAPAEESPAATPEVPVEEPSQAPAQEPSEAPIEEPVEEEVGFVDYELPITTDNPTYTFLMGVNPGVASYITGMEENQVMDEWMKRTGINIEFYGVHPSAATEKFNLLLAADTPADIADNGLKHYGRSATDAVDEGVFADLMEYSEYCPNYYHAITSNETMRKALTTDCGYVPAMYMIRTNNVAGEGLMVRQDWLDQLGLDVPETYDEVHNMLAAFKSELGVEGGLLLNNSGTWSLGAFGWGYDINGYCTTDPTISLPLSVENGQVKFAMMEDRYVDYLTMLAQWYQEGLIVSDIESVTMFQMCTDRIVNDQVGYFFTASAMVDYYKKAAISESFTVSPAPQPKLTPDSELHFGSAYSFDYENSKALAALNSWTVSADAHDIETLIQCIDYLYSPEGTLLCNYGVEGVSFEYNESGKPVFTELITKNAEGMTTDNAVYIYTLQYGAFVEDMTRFIDSYSDIQLKCSECWTVYPEDSYVYPTDFISLTTEESDTYAAYTGDIMTFVSENVLKFITGGKDMSEYADFRAQLESLGVNEIIGVYQSAYDRFMNR